MELLKKGQHEANIQIPHILEWAMHPSYEEIKKYKQLDINVFKY